MRLFRAFRSVGDARRLLVNSYSEVSAVSADLAVEYDVLENITAVGANYSLEWDAVAAVAASYSLGWATVQAVGLSYLNSWYIGEGRITNTRLLREFRKSGSLNRMLLTVGRLGSPSADYTAAWNVGGTVTRDIQWQWQIQSQGPGTGDPLGDPFIVGMSGIAASGTVDMSSPLSAINRDLLFVYNVNGAIGSAQPNSPTLAIGPIAASGSVAMSSVQLTVSADMTAQYSIVNAATLSYTNRWTINTSATLDYLLRWNVAEFSAVSADLNINYSTVSAAGRSLSLEYSIFTPVSAGYQFQYFVLDQNAVAFEFIPRWNVLAKVETDLALEWDSAGRQFSDLSLLWRVGIRPAIDVIVRVPDDEPTIYADCMEGFAYPKINDAYITTVRF